MMMVKGENAGGCGARRDSGIATPGASGGEATGAADVQ
jgi:hypothetical protein